MLPKLYHHRLKKKKKKLYYINFLRFFEIKLLLLFLLGTINELRLTFFFDEYIENDFKRKLRYGKRSLPFLAYFYSSFDVNIAKILFVLEVTMDNYLSGNQNCPNSTTNL